MTLLYLSFFFFFNDTATTEIYTLSLHDALPISFGGPCRAGSRITSRFRGPICISRSEEHTSELQSPCNIVCRLLLEKKNDLAGIRHRRNELGRHEGADLDLP